MIESKIKNTGAKLKHNIEGEIELNKVVFLSKGDAVEEDERIANMEKLFKKWNINKGLWFNDMQVKDHIQRIRTL